MSRRFDQYTSLSTAASDDLYLIWDTSASAVKIIEAADVGGGLVVSEGEAYIFVGGSSSATTNGTDLTTAYSNATSKTPHGSALSASNRYTIFLRPGRFSLTSAALDLTASFIDIVGLGSKEDVILTSNGKTITISKASPDIVLANLTIHTTVATPTDSSSSHGYHLTSTGSHANLRHYNVDFRADNAYAAMRGNVDYSGYYLNCRCLAGYSGAGAGEGGFGIGYASGEVGTASGTFVRCISGERSFGACFNGDTATASGDFYDCEGGANCFGSGAAVNASTASGNFYRCSSGTQSFGARGVGGATPSGYFEDCESGSDSFGNNVLTRNITVAGTFINCRGTSTCFGSFNNGSGGAGLITITGRFESCRGTSSCFGGGTSTNASISIGGTFVDCKATSSSFGSNGGTISATFINCEGTTSCFGQSNSVTMSGVIDSCITTGEIKSKITGELRNCKVTAVTADTPAIEIGSTAKIYNATLIGTGTANSIYAASAQNAIISHCRLNKGIHANVTNLVSTPYNVDDSDIA